MAQLYSLHRTDNAGEWFVEEFDSERNLIAEYVVTKNRPRAQPKHQPQWPKLDDPVLMLDLNPTIPIWP